MKFNFPLLSGLLLVLLSSCTSSVEPIQFSLDSSQNPVFELSSDALPVIQWTPSPTPTPRPNLPVLGSFTMALNHPLYTLRTEGVGTDFQETETFQGLLYQSLLNYKLFHKTYTPVLACRWSYVPGQKAPLYFEIAPEARWSDDTPVTADDVVATFNFLKSDDLEQREKTQFFQGIEATALSKDLVRVSLPSTDPASFFRLALQPIYPAKELTLYTAKTYLGAFNDRALMGSGPYLLDLERSSKEKELNFVHKENYWGREMPYLKNLYNFQNVTYRIISDAKTREWSFKKGLLDALVITSARDWQQNWTVEKEPLLARGIWQKRKVFNFHPNGVSGVAINLRRPPLSDVRLRQALAHLWDRQSIIDSLFLGEYLPTNSFYPGSDFENPRNIKYNYNPAQARQLLANMGYTQAAPREFLYNSQGKTLDLEFLITPREMPFFHQFSTDAKQLGINLKVTVLPNNALQLRLIDHDFDLAYTGFRGLLFPRPDLQFASSLADVKNSLNIWGIKNTTIDKLLTNFTGKTSEQQKQVIQDVDYLLSEKILFLYGWYSPYSNRLIYWNKFNQPLGLLGAYGNYRMIAELWSINPSLEAKVQNRDDPSVTLPVGEETLNYYQSQL